METVAEVLYQKMISPYLGKHLVHVIPLPHPLFCKEEYSNIFCAYTQAGSVKSDQSHIGYFNIHRKNNADEATNDSSLIMTAL
jgi:hypothetical protein